MSDSREKSELVANVVEALYGDMLSRLPKIKEDWPEEIKERALKSHEAFRENHRKFSLELYEKHMTVEQLQALLDYHTSDMGKAIKDAERKIQQEMSQKYRALEAEKETTRPDGLVVVRTKTYGLDDDEET